MQTKIRRHITREVETLNDGLVVRISTEHKNSIADAAKASGLSLAAFIRQVAIDAALCGKIA